MKKILYITTVSRTINAFLVPHIEMLIEEGYKVDCACYIDKPIDSRLISKNVNIYNIPFTRNPLHPKNIRAFKELINIQKQNQYDIVHVHTPVAGVYGRLLKIKFPSIKMIYTAHGFHFYKGAPILNWIIYYPIEKIMSRFTDTIITMNEEDYRRSKKFNIKNTHKINGVGLDINEYESNYIDYIEKRRELNIKEDDFVILMIAEVNKNKNHIQMIEAINKLNNKHIKVICAGDGILFDKISSYIEKKELNDQIKMLGFRKDVSDLIKICDIGMLLSYREGLPRNIMELMSQGKPVIGTNIRGIKDIISNGKTGYLVDIMDIDNTVNKINLLYKDKLLRNNMAQNCINESYKFEVDNVLDYLIKIINIK